MAERKWKKISTWMAAWVMAVVFAVSGAQTAFAATSYVNSVSITLDEDVIEKIRLFAEETDRSFSQYINLLLRKHISAREARDEAKSDE